MQSLVRGNRHANSSDTIKAFFAVAMVVCIFSMPEVAMAYTPGDAEGQVTRFFKSINGLLNIASIAVVTIAVIFAGYQIAFAHKRIADVAPVLIGGFLIGAAAQIAKMLMGDNQLDTAMLMSTMSMFYA